MITEPQLQEKKIEWRELLLDSMGQALKALEAYIPEAAVKHNTLLSLKGRLNDANQKKIMGVLSAEQLQLQYNQLRHDLLIFIDGLQPADFEPAAMPMGKAPNAPRRGTLLHKIPRRMAIGQEEECIIRLAYERAVIANDLEITEEVEVKEVTISRVMQAELIDPGESPAFSIRSFSDEEQFLQQGEYTEWKFYVKPLKVGAFPLLLKITVVEMIDGHERLRNISWEETIEIEAEASEATVVAFAATGINLSFEEQSKKADRAAGPTLTGDGSYPELDKVQEGAPAAQHPPAPAPAAPERRLPGAEAARPQPRRRSYMRGLSIAASVVVILGLTTYLWMPVLNESSGNPSGKEKSEDVNAGDSPAEPALSEEEAWRTALEKDTRAAYESFLQLYPEGEYALEARKRMSKLDN
jgi:hypothetical protein